MWGGGRDGGGNTGPRAERCLGGNDSANGMDGRGWRIGMCLQVRTLVLPALLCQILP